jgi:surface polysaccharide O-acyltransferase-like enzyme
VRALAVVLVVAIHADHWPAQNGGGDLAVWTTVDRLSRVAVPLFVTLTGFLLTYRRQAELPRRAFLRRRFGRSLLPWLVWMPVYTVIGLLLTAEVPHDWSGAVKWCLLGGGHLWYLILVPQLYLVFLVWPRGTRGLVVAAGLALALQAALGAYRLYAPAAAPFNGLFLAAGFEFFCYWIGYFAVGAALGSVFAVRRPRWPAWPWWLVAAAGAVLLVAINVQSAANGSFAQGTGAFLLPALPVLALGVFLAIALGADPVLRRHPRLCAAVAYVSRYSLGVYIVHEALLYLPGRLLAGLLEANLPVSALAFPVLVASSLGLALVVTRLLVATPLAITLGGEREPPPWPLVARRRGAEAP